MFTPSCSTRNVEEEKPSCFPCSKGPTYNCLCLSTRILSYFTSISSPYRFLERVDCWRGLSIVFPTLGLPLFRRSSVPFSRDGGAFYRAQCLSSSSSETVSCYFLESDNHRPVLIFPRLFGYGRKDLTRVLTLCWCRSRI